MKRLAAALAATLTLAASLAPRAAHAGPETALREFASGQIKKGVRSIGMGGNGATWGNYALVGRDAGSMVLDYGAVHFTDTGDRFTFTAVGFTSPSFWDGAALYVIAMAQHATDVRVWSVDPSASHPASTGDGSNQGVFVKFAKPLSRTISAGVLLSYELSQMTLLPDDAARGPIRYQTTWLPSGGAGVSWTPSKRLLAGVRVILNHDQERRIDPKGAREGLARSYEYRAGASYLPWDGGLIDVGAVVLDRSNGLDGTTTRTLQPTLGVEQAIVRKRVWVRAGRDETTWTSGMSVRGGPFKLDLAYLWNLGAERTGDVFGKRNVGLFATLTYHYAAEPR